MDINALKIGKSLLDFAANIHGIVPQFGGRCFEITLDCRSCHSRSSIGYNYGDDRKPLKLLGVLSIHVSIFLSIEFPDEDLISLVTTYGELKARQLGNSTSPRRIFSTLKTVFELPNLQKSNEQSLNG